MKLKIVLFAVILGSFFRLDYAMADQVTLKSFACSSQFAGRIVATLGSRSYIDVKSGNDTEIPVINAWIEGLSSNKPFTDVRYDKKKNKFFARAKFFKKTATVTIQPDLNLVVVKYNGKTNTYVHSICSTITGE